jgi:hypothetical protein
MKFKLLLCGAALLVAGCESPSNPYGASGEYSFTYDYVPEPVPGMTATELEALLQAQANAAEISAGAKMNSQ